MTNPTPEQIPEEHIRGPWVMVCHAEGKYEAVNANTGYKIIIYQKADYATALSMFERMFP